MQWNRRHIVAPRPRTPLQRKLHAAFAFFFPVLGFILFSLRYSLLGDELVPYFFGLLVFSGIGFSIPFEMLRLLTENERGLRHVRSIDTIGKLLNSSLRDSERLAGVLHELQRVVEFDTAVVLLKDPDHPSRVHVKEWVGSGTGRLRRNTVYGTEGSLVEKTFQQEAARVLEVGSDSGSELDRALFADSGAGGCFLAPLRSGGSVFGALVLVGRRLEPLIEANRLVSWVAGAMGLAIDRNRLRTAVVKLYKESAAAAEQERNVRQVFQKFVPREVVDTIIHDLENGTNVIEEVKRVTLLNIDIRGFSRLAKQMGPQRTVALLNRFFAAMGEVVFRHHGVVDKYLGDGFLAVFGAPVSRTGDAENAVQAALEMRRRQAEMNLSAGVDAGTVIHMGIGIHTGEVVVGNIGFEKKMDYTVIGDSVNTVFRMQALVKPFPNGILISGATLRSVRTRLKVHAVAVPEEVQRDLGAMAVYELLEAETDAGPASAGNGAFPGPHDATAG
jgi:class 3 adenylate cyclase